MFVDSWHLSEHRAEERGSQNSLAQRSACSCVFSGVGEMSTPTIEVEVKSKLAEEPTPCHLG